MYKIFDYRIVYSILIDIVKLHIFIFSPEQPLYPTETDYPVCECGYKFKHPIHIQNNGVVCDPWWTPCVCGQWHDVNYVEETNRIFTEHISTPNYVLSDFEAEIVKLMTE